MDKRHLTRVELSEWASIRYQDQMLFGDLENLSFQGLYFVTDQIVPINTLVSVDTPYSQISLRANVVRQDHNGIGLKIVDIKLPAFLNLKKVIKDNFQNRGMYLRELQHITVKIQPARLVPKSVKTD